ncbi:MAG: PBP1A family penicillin-binding protein [Bdellovibrionota bacterium]
MKVLFSFLKYLFIVLVVSTVVCSVIGIAMFASFSRGLPSIVTTEDYKPLTVTRIYGRGDAVVGEFFEERRYVVDLEKISEITQKAFIAAEDDRFFDHQGIDLQGIMRAAIANFRAGRVVQGGSTITQQVAKSLLLTPERSFVRKMKEVIIANRMEKNLNKNQILFLYLNQIYLGQGAYGVEAAARIYFNKEAKDLTIAESALLAGLPQAPSKYSPLAHPKQAKQRQQYVLRRLMEDGTISRDEMERSLREPVKIYLGQDLNEKYAPYYVEHVRKYLLEKYGKETLYGSGLSVHTPIDPKLSVVAMKALEEGLRSMDKKQGYRGPIMKVRTQSEVASAVAELTDYNLSQKFPYRVLMPDGEHSIDFKARIESGKTELDAFEENAIYQGLVLGVDDKKKEVLVDLGLLKGTIALERMRWAQLVKVPSSTGVEPLVRPSQALSKGDVIFVRLVTKPSARTELASLALEQEPAVQGALLSMDVITGEVNAMVGGYSFKQSEFNRAIQAERQPGSVFKPIIYAAAIDKGYTPATIIQDSPIVFDAGENEKWKPENFEEKFYGDTTFRSSLIRSRNIPTIKIVQDIEIPYLIDYAKRLGFPDKFNKDLSIALGSSTVSLLDLCRVYAVFPRGGRQVKPIFINKVVDRDGKVLEEQAFSSTANIESANLAPPPKPVLVAGQLQAERSAEQIDATRGVFTPDPIDPARVMDPRTAYVMTHLMNEVATVGTGSEAKNLGRPAAGKTGTTNDYLDAWFMGFTPQVVTGVWMGFDAQKSLGPRSTGGLVALPIWLEFMKEAVKPYPVTEFTVPKGVTFAFIDSKTGKPARANRAGAIREVFIEGTEPTFGGRTGLASTPSQAAGSGGTGVQVQPAGAGDSTDEEFFKRDIE